MEEDNDLNKSAFTLANRSRPPSTKDRQPTSMFLARDAMAKTGLKHR